ncbi:unnamed protein product [Adineta steineri]|uniref:Nuclear protein MDM1 n=1 Tax=Adineta steineri TaxID=433720 RepID=A0A818WAX1_9BILA|nr:unnamed protein product [Adineta steineri]
MKYQTEYQRNYQKRTPRKFNELPVEERKLNEVPIRRSASSPSRRRGRSVPSSPKRDDSNFAVIGPNEKFSQSQLYRMKQPVKDNHRVAKSQEFALLGKNAKFENNVVYPLRKPVVTDTPQTVVVRRRKSENHSCGVQTELKRTTSASYDLRHQRDGVANRKRRTPQSEYKQQYNWKQSAEVLPSNQVSSEESKVRERRSEPKASSSAVTSPKKASVAVNTPARVEIDVNRNKQQAQRPATHSTKAFRPKRDDTTEYRQRYKPTLVEPKHTEAQKTYHAQYVDERTKRNQIPEVEHAHTDDEGTGGNVDLGTEFRQKYPHGKLRRWKSEYQSTYKPFSRFDYKNGKWFKDPAADEKGFNPNLFWYKELMSTRKRADEFRSKAETDHFNPDHTLQLKTGYGTDNYHAWDTDADDDDSESIISIDRDLERERLEGERRREKDAKRNEDEHIHHEKPKNIKKPTTFKTDRVAQTDHKVDRVIYVDEPPVKQPSAATKAFVRNLGSSSVQQHMSWDSESLYSQRTNSDIDLKSITARDLHNKHYQNDNSTNRTNVSRKSSPKKKQSRGTETHSPLPNDRQQKTCCSSQINERTTHQNGTHTHHTRPATSYQETSNATGRPSYDTHTYDKRPHSSMNDYCSYPASRFKDEVTDYYYGGNENKQQYQYTPTTKPSLQNQAGSQDERYGRNYPTRNQDDDVLSVNSVRSLSSSCSLASQTLERAHQNMNKYWGDNSPKKTYNAKH